jgi:hypothetical protein
MMISLASGPPEHHVVPLDLDRTQAAAKVDAMSSGGMDNYEIPAFLRKQAD